MSKIVLKYVNELVAVICAEYGADDEEQKEQLRVDFTNKLTDAFTRFGDEVSGDLPIDDMLSMASKVGATINKKTGKTGYHGTGWHIFSKKFTKANAWSREETSQAWKALSDDERAEYNLEAKKLREASGGDAGGSGTVASGGDGKRNSPWTGFQKYYTYEAKQRGEKYNAGQCSIEYKKLSDAQKNGYRGWAAPVADE